MEDIKCLLIRVYGIVQGVGFRPFVSRIAAKAGILGSVCNKGPYVEIIAQGDDKQLADFLARLKTQAPERSTILKIETSEIPAKKLHKFEIIKSGREKGEIFVSPDIAICKKCKEELFDKENRRYLHPFINCTACGPRLTILDSMPYDRERTSMSEFPMCADCHDEYTDPKCRRYHAQPVCCNKCGPRLYIPGSEKEGAEALIFTREVIRGGGIAAIKGIGGFHLCCDAKNAEAVSRLRRLKNRPFKPFAVMLRDMETVRRECKTDEAQEALLDGPQKPIILLERSGRGEICPEVAPGNPKIGVMLPYAPIQLLLFSYPDGKDMTDCFVMTSGNPSGAPICRNDEEAVKELSGMCDVILSNDRKIRLRADDSVMAFFEGRPYMIRRSRGYAPLPVVLPHVNDGSVLAVGGELKNTFCLARGNLLYLSPYIADLADLRSVKALEEATARMERLLEISPQAVACDLHPKYNSTEFAKSLGLPVIQVQHHYAHIASCMAENGFEEEVIGVAFDGTGYGTDGTIWGGEFLKASYSGFERLGSIAPFRQAGGELAVKEGWRVALSLLLNAFGSESAAGEAAEKLGLCDKTAMRTQFAMLKNNINCVTSTSAGRLFDAASAILGIKRRSTFEGEASSALEYAADKNTGYNFEPNISTYMDGRFIIEISGLIKYLAEKAIEGTSKSYLAGAFHSAVAQMVSAGCIKCRELTGINTVALSGGVFQNLLLLEKCVNLLKSDGFYVLTHSLVPPNDGGIALGQAAVALNKL
jgi:[NiFe] hydrogenase maturation protein HypF